MSMENKSYLASDLAQELAVARSTINDWLTRYADYLEVDVRGKRKVYSEKSLRILREISDMRNSGAGSFDIEQQLAARYGIRPEVAPEPETPSAVGPGSGEPENPSPGAPAGDALPMLRPAFDEMAAKFTGEFSRLANKLEALEAERRRLIHRVWLMMAVILIGGAALAAALGGAVWLGYGKFSARSDATAAAVENLNDGGVRLAAEVGRLTDGQQRADAEAKARAAELTVLLDRSGSDFQAAVRQLRSELAAQRGEFERQLKSLEANADSRAVAEILKLKAEFARSQQAELDKVIQTYEAKLAAATAGGVKSKQEAEQAGRDLTITRGELEELRRKVAELEKARSGTPSAVTPAEAKP